MFWGRWFEVMVCCLVILILCQIVTLISALWLLQQ